MKSQENTVEIPVDVEAFLSQGFRTFIATRRKDGSITCHPMARFYAEGRCFFNMYASSVKHKNLLRDDRIACLMATMSDVSDFQSSIWRGHARELSADETLAKNAPPGVVLARGIGMEGVKKIDDAPEKFVGEDPEDWLKRAAVMEERIRDRVRVLWEVERVETGWLRELREV